MALRFWQRKTAGKALNPAKILVIGSAHLDVLAEFNNFGQENAIDKIGSSVNIGFGGTALNITAWLQELGQKPYLLTAINKSSFTGQTVINAMRAGGLAHKYVIDDKELPDSAFVATVSNRRLHSAVSYMSVNESGSIGEKIEKIVTKFRWVVFDCNLSYGTIERIAEICQRRQIGLIGAATSDTKAARLAATRAYGTRALSMNHREAVILGRELGIVADDFDRLRATLNTRALLVTAGADGWHLAQDNGEMLSYPPPAGIVPVTTIGAGDAACAGLVDALIDRDPIPDRVNRVVARALRSRFPTRFAERTSPDALGRFAQSQNQKRILLAVLSAFALVAFGWFVKVVLTWFLELGLGRLLKLIGVL